MRRNDGLHTVSLSQHLDFQTESTYMFAMIVEMYRWKHENQALEFTFYGLSGSQIFRYF